MPSLIKITITISQDNDHRNIIKYQDNDDQHNQQMQPHTGCSLEPPYLFGRSTPPQPTCKCALAMYNILFMFTIYFLNLDKVQHIKDIFICSQLCFNCTLGSASYCHCWLWFCQLWVIDHWVKLQYLILPPCLEAPVCLVASPSVFCLFELFWSLPDLVGCNLLRWSASIQGGLD